jgi:hypothetical protein
MTDNSCLQLLVTAVSSTGAGEKWTSVYFGYWYQSHSDLVRCTGENVLLFSSA